VNENGKRNRDIARQNKASTLVTANLFSNVIKEGSLHINEITKSMESLQESGEIQQGINAIININKTISEANEQAMKDYSRCSTYVKTGGLSIAHRETQIIKHAIHFGEEESLEEEMRHYNKLVVSMQKAICSSFGSFKNTTSLQLVEGATNSYNNEHFNSTSISDNLPPHPSIISKRKTNRAPKPSNYRSFLLPPPEVHKKYYSPIQAITIVNNNSDLSTKIILDLPKVKIDTK
jgi:hypothetical protein